MSTEGFSILGGSIPDLLTRLLLCLRERSKKATRTLLERSEQPCDLFAGCGGHASLRLQVRGNVVKCAL